MSQESESEKPLPANRLFPVFLRNSATGGEKERRPEYHDVRLTRRDEDDNTELRVIS